MPEKQQRQPYLLWYQVYWAKCSAQLSVSAMEANPRSVYSKGQWARWWKLKARNATYNAIITCDVLSKVCWYKTRSNTIDTSIWSHFSCKSLKEWRKIKRKTKKIVFWVYRVFLKKQTNIKPGNQIPTLVKPNKAVLVTPYMAIDDCGW